MITTDEASHAGRHHAGDHQRLDQVWPLSWRLAFATWLQAAALEQGVPLDHIVALATRARS